MQFYKPWNLVCPMAVQHSIFNNWLHYLLTFGLGAAMKTAEEEEEKLYKGPN